MSPEQTFLSNTMSINLKTLCLEVKGERSNFIRANLKAAINFIHRQNSLQFKEGDVPNSIRDLEDYIQAFNHLCDAQRYEQASNLFLFPLRKINGSVIAKLLGIWGEYQEVIRCSQSLLGHQSSRIDLLCTRLVGNAYYNLNDYQKSEEYTKKSLRVAELTGDKEQEAESYFILGSISREKSDYTQAIHYYETSLEIAVQLENIELEAKLVQSLGTIQHKMHQENEAIKYHQRALELAIEANDRHWQGITLTDMSLSYLELGDYSKALELNEKGIELAREIGNRAGEGWCHCNQGKILARTGDIDKASRKFQKSLEIFASLNKPAAQQDVYEAIAFVYLQLQQNSIAISNCIKAKNISDQLGISLAEHCRQLLIENANLD
ncbi:hypothetical protein Lepto7375DRAFT_7463 [Leptolyngbya sp. PCC 7375]|nr:hypothetical protein Lepto7375DRAFT_7463 [Leptolyngbya sp. PCC 7375]